jgi:glycosyltransferase involved in cell wall biosynthesis
MHTQPVDNNGTDLIAVKEAVCPDYNVVFSTNRLDTRQMNYLYNLVDVTINIASNEGFGISWCESLHTGTPIINNVTGGLQDGCRFEDENGDWIKFDTVFSSNHTGKYKKHGVWARPVFPTNRSLQGSPQTPYIFDDRADFEDVAEAIMYWYKLSSDKREEYGNAGREWILSDESRMSASKMCAALSECVDTCLDNWKPRKRFTLYKVKQKEQIKNTGILTK